MNYVMENLNCQSEKSDEFTHSFPALFSKCKAEDAAVLMNAFTPSSEFSAGSNITQQGSFSDTLYLVCSGLLGVSIEGDNKNINLGMISRGQWVGDVSVIYPGPASATVRVLEDAKLMWLSHEGLNRLRTQRPRTASRLMNALSEVLADRLRMSSNLAVNITRQPIAGVQQIVNSNHHKKRILNLGRWLAGLRHEEMEQFAKEELSLQQKELQQKFNHLYHQEKDKLLANERERILAELHDGVGGQLVAMLSMLDNRQVASAELMDTVRAALDDLRLMIDSLDETEGDIPVVLGMFRSRLEPRLAAQGIRFDWQVTDLPLVSALGPHEVLQILRILQEAVTNIIKHADSDLITVITEYQVSNSGNEIISIVIKDNGKGFVGRDNRAGHGMETMKRRACDIGGNLYVESGVCGTTVTLDIPVVTTA